MTALTQPPGRLLTIAGYAALSEDDRNRWELQEGYDAAVLTDKGDRTVLPDKLRAKQMPQWDAILPSTEAGMRLIERETLRLRQPDDAELDETYRRCRSLHAQAFGWDPPDVAGLERLGATRMRQYVRAWINEWDLVRLDPSFLPQTEVTELASNYAEEPDLDAEER